jgi:L-rhamnose isomerase
MSNGFQLAQEQYAAFEVDVESALSLLAAIPISIQCWQGDDVGGFENSESDLGGGLAVTGNYPGKARNADELRADAEQAMRHLPGRHRFNLHASYAETGGRKVDRNALNHEHFSAWIDWAKSLKIGLDFNPTYFAHRLASSGMTLAHADPHIRQFWIEHGRATRRIAAAFGAELGDPAVHNIWIPDGMKDTPVDRWSPRARLQESLDEILQERLPSDQIIDSVEGKLFGIDITSRMIQMDANRTVSNLL